MGFLGKDSCIVNWAKVAPSTPMKVLTLTLELSIIIIYMRCICFLRQVFNLVWLIISFWFYSGYIHLQACSVRLVFNQIIKELGRSAQIKCEHGACTSASCLHENFNKNFGSHYKIQWHKPLNGFSQFCREKWEITRGAEIGTVCRVHACSLRYLNLWTKVAGVTGVFFFPDFFCFLLQVCEVLAQLVHELWHICIYIYIFFLFFFFLLKLHKLF